MTELEYYNEIGNWSFDDIKYSVESKTNWDLENEIKKHVTSASVILDLGTGGGEKVLARNIPYKEILGTDFSPEMIKTANKNLVDSKKENISFRVMDNLHMDTKDDYFDLVVARNTVTDAKGIYKTLKSNGTLIIRGVDKLDCFSLKRMFDRGQAYKDVKPISLIDYENVLDAGFKDAELIPIHEIEYYETKEDLLALLLKTPILDDFSEEDNNSYNKVPIEEEIFEKYIEENKTDKGIKLIRRYYAIVARKE